MYNSQQARIAIKVLGIIILLFVFGTAMFIYMSGHYQIVTNRERQSFGMVTKRLEMNLNTRLMTMEFLASDPEIKGLKPEEVKRELVRPVEVLKFFNVGVVDQKGNFVSEMRPACAQNVLYDLDSFNKVLVGQKAITDVKSCEEHSNVSLRVPIYDDNGNVHAVLVGVILVDEIAKWVEEEYLGPNRYIFVMDGNNNKIYYPEEKSDNEFYRDRQIYFENKVRGIVRDESTGYADSRLYIYQTVENSNWRIVMVVPMVEIYKLILQRSLNFFIVSCLLILCISLLYRNYQQRLSHDEDRNRLRMERLLSVNQLAAGLAHEIRNPLTAIKGFIQLMARRADQVPKQNHMAIILTEIDRIDKLVGEFQLLTRPLETPNYVQIDVAQMVNNVMILMESQAVEKSVLLDFIVDGVAAQNTLYILGEESQLKQVLINLIKNAIEVVEENGKVDISLAIRNEMAVIAIKDNGVGMTKEILKKIGTPFFTTKNSGNGLGLSVCYNIIHNHGGKVEVQSEVGKGTIFSIVLPYQVEVK